MILTAQPGFGQSLDEACAQAIQLATMLQVGIQFTFAGVTLTAYAGNLPEDLLAEHRLKSK